MDKTPLIPDEKMHGGHRSRMRDKFLRYGPRFFDTYELLEMLLYYSIPYKDTNPIAKRLLMEFGSLEGVMSASEEELVGVSGIGKRTAELISAVNLAAGALFLSETARPRVFNDYSTVGAYLAEYLSQSSEYKVAMLLLDNSMREIDLVTVYCGRELQTSRMMPKDFIDKAILSGASVVMIGCNHPHGPLCHFESENEANRLLSSALHSSGILLAECYVTVGSDFIGTESYSESFVKTNSELDVFMASKRRAVEMNRARMAEGVARW